MKDLEDGLVDVNQKKQRLCEEIALVQVGKEDSSERTNLLTQLEEKRHLRSRLIKDLEAFKSCDPQHLSQLSKSCDPHVSTQ